MKRKYIVWISVMLLLVLTALPVMAEEDSCRIPEELSANLPEEVKEVLKDITDYDSLTSAETTETVLSFSSALIRKSLTSFFSSFSKIFGAVLFSLLMGTLSSSFSNSMGDTYRLICTVVLGSICYGILSELFTVTKEYLTSLSAFMNTLTVVCSALCVKSGNVLSASSICTGTALLVSAVENIGVYLLFPLLKICFALSLASSVSGETQISKLSGFVKKTFISMTVFLMTVLTIILSFQTSIASSADSVAVRSLRFAAVTSIPIVGGAVGESLRTITSGLNLAKSLCGGYSALALVIMTLIPVSEMIAAKLSFSLADAGSSLLSDDSSCLISESSSLIGCLLAIISMFSVMFLFIISLYMKSVSSFI